MRVNRRWNVEGEEPRRTPWRESLRTWFERPEPEPEAEPEPEPVAAP